MWTIITTLLGAATGGILGFSGSYFSQKKASDFYEAQERKRIYREKLEILFERFCYLENAVLIVFRFKSSPQTYHTLFVWVKFFVIIHMRITKPTIKMGIA